MSEREALEGKRMTQLFRAALATGTGPRNVLRDVAREHGKPAYLYDLRDMVDGYGECAWRVFAYEV